MNDQSKTKEKGQPGWGSPEAPPILPVEDPEKDKTPYSMFTVEAAREILKETRRFIKEAFTEGVDYEVRKKGKATEKSLLKPGAEKLALKFKLRPELELQHRIMDWDNSLFYFEFMCRLIHIPSRQTVAEYVASCNSFEEKYRYRWVPAKDIPADVDKASLPSKTRDGYSGPYTSYRIQNPYVPDQISTIIQMAQKRAFVGCVRIGTQTSDDFTQDESGSNGAGEPRAATEKSPRTSSAPTKKGLVEAQELKDELYKHFGGDEDAVNEFAGKVIKAGGTIPFEKLPAAKLQKIRKALEEKKAEKKDDPDMPF